MLCGPENRDAVGLEFETPRGGEWEGVSPSQPTSGSGGASYAPPAGSRAEPRPKTDSGAFLA